MHARTHASTLTHADIRTHAHNNAHRQAPAHARTRAYALSTLGRARALACRSPHADSCHPRADPAAGAGASVDRAFVGIAVGIAGWQRHARAIQAGLRVLLHAPVRPAPREYSECAACWRVGYRRAAPA
jgi:hypothetical protein